MNIERQQHCQSWRDGKKVDLKEPSRKEDNLIIKNQRSFSQSFDNLHVNNSYQTSRFKGLNIVDLVFVYKKLLDECKACKTTFSLI